MASEPPQTDMAPPQPDSTDQNEAPAADATKRKAEQTNGTHTRTKRNRYISIAWYDSGSKIHRDKIPDLSHLRDSNLLTQSWVLSFVFSNECKRRKIKCNGQVPCQRCGHLNLEC